MLSSFLRINEIDNYSPLVLSISFNVNKKFLDEISLYAAIQLNNYNNSYWRNNSNNKDDEDNIIINEEDKKFIRSKILDIVIYVIEIENIIIIKKFSQYVKKLCKYYFKGKIIDYNKKFINRIITCLNNKKIKIIFI